MKYRVFYDGSCLFCVHAAGLLSRLDWFKQLNMIDLHLSDVLENAGVTRSKALTRIQVQNQRGEVFEGMPAILRISMKIPLLRVFVPIFWFSIQIGFGNKLYDWIAARRMLFPTPGFCER